MKPSGVGEIDRKSLYIHIPVQVYMYLHKPTIMLFEMSTPLNFKANLCWLLILKLIYADILTGLSLLNIQKSVGIMLKAVFIFTYTENICTMIDLCKYMYLHIHTYTVLYAYDQDTLD